MNKKKLLKFCKKPLFRIAFCVLVVSFIVISVLVCIPNVSKYTYHEEAFGIILDVEAKFNKEKEEVTIVTAVAGGENEGRVADTSKYEIKSRKLYTYGDNVVNGYHKVGSINAFEIKFELKNAPSEVSEMLSGISLTCGWSCFIRDFMFAMVIISIACMIFSVLLTVYTRKKQKDKQQVVVEVVSSSDGSGAKE